MVPSATPAKTKRAGNRGKEEVCFGDGGRRRGKGEGRKIYQGESEGVEA